MNNNFTIEKPMPPIWMMYPDIQNGSIGWRMGAGEYYRYSFNDWFNSLTRNDREEYMEMFPAPKDFRSYYIEDDKKKFDDFYSENGEYYTKFTYSNDNFFIEFWNEYGVPEYDFKDLQKDYMKGKKLDFLFFFGHTNDKENVTKSCLSQWYISNFKESIYNFNCMEKYMMYCKADLFNDEKIKKEILENSSPKTIKELGRKVQSFNENIWNKIKYSIVLHGNYYKFTQNESLMRFILSTKNKVLAEASPYDKVWGIKMSADDENVNNPTKWKGENLLGFALMEVRGEIRRVYKNYDKIDWEYVKKIYDN